MQGLLPHCTLLTGNFHKRNVAYSAASLSSPNCWFEDIGRWLEAVGSSYAKEGVKHVAGLPLVKALLRSIRLCQILVVVWKGGVCVFPSQSSNPDVSFGSRTGLQHQRHCSSGV